VVKVLEESAFLEADKRLIGFGFNLEAPTDLTGPHRFAVTSPPFHPSFLDRNDLARCVTTVSCRIRMVDGSITATVLLEDIDLDRGPPL
jgi:hypothetical protein